MERLDDGGDDAGEANHFDPVPRAMRRRFFSEPAGPAQPDAPSTSSPTLFSDPDAEKELRAEMRLSQLWNTSRAGIVTVAESGELRRLISEVHGIPGVLCMDCATLERQNVGANCALGDTMLCRGHLRSRLGCADFGGDAA